jgi:hypothetical protein
MNVDTSAHGGTGAFARPGQGEARPQAGITAFTDYCEAFCFCEDMPGSNLSR